MTTLAGFICFVVGCIVAEAISTLLFPRRIKHEFDDRAPIIHVKRLHPDAKLPSYAKDGDAGADICTVEDVEFNSGEWKLVRCGFAMELPPDWEAQCRSRSGLALKNGLVVLNSPGTIDSGYRGEMGAIVMNHGPAQILAKGSRIAQLVIARAPQAIFVTADELSESDRGAGGFGSTGVKS